MEADHVGQVNLGQHVPVEDHHGFLQVVPGEADGAAGAQWLWLHDVADPDAGLGPVTEDLFDEIRTVVEAQPHLVDLWDPFQPVELIVQKRAVEDRNNGFGNLERQGAEACAHAASEEDCLHAKVP